MAKANLDIDELRKGFANRINELIQNEDGESKLENFSRRMGISMRQLSQWKNPRHISWPSAQAIMQFAIQGDISPTWLLLGKGPKHLGVRK